MVAQRDPLIFLDVDPPDVEVGARSPAFVVSNSLAVTVPRSSGSFERPPGISGTVTLIFNRPISLAPT